MIGLATYVLIFVFFFTAVSYILIAAGSRDEEPLSVFCEPHYGVRAEGKYEGVCNDGTTFLRRTRLGGDTWSWND
jgi:hypothetical protein